MPAIRNIVILTGAGISAESGIDTFRDSGGLWERVKVEDVATPEAFARDPDLVLRFYDMRRAAIQTKQPNAAHAALARLDAEVNVAQRSHLGEPEVVRLADVVELDQGHEIAQLLSFGEPSPLDPGPSFGSTFTA